MQYKSRLVFAVVWITLFPLFARAIEPAATQPNSDRAALLRGCRGTYGSPPRLEDKHVDIPLLLAQLKELHATTYNWLIWQQATDWDDLHLFLRPAREAGIQVWVTLVPPSESPPRTKMYAEPFKMDYDRWAVEIAKLSVTESNLIAWSIDDFALNQPTFTPEKTRAMLAAANAINPRLAFVPVIYWRFLKPGLAAYKGLFDGVLYPYRHDSVKMNLVDFDTVKPELDKIRELLGPGPVIIVDIYQTKHSRAGSSTPAYVRDMMVEARKYADGVMIYTHPNPVKDPEKYGVIRDGFAGQTPR